MFYLFIFISNPEFRKNFLEFLDILEDSVKENNIEIFGDDTIEYRTNFFRINRYIRKYFKENNIEIFYDDNI